MALVRAQTSVKAITPLCMQLDE